MKAVTGAQRQMIASLLPGYWAGGGGTPRTRSVLAALERRGLCERATDEHGRAMYKLSEKGERYHRALQMTAPCHEPRAAQDER